MSAVRHTRRNNAVSSLDVIEMLERDMLFSEQTLDIIERLYNETGKLPPQLVKRLTAELRVCESIRCELVYPAADFKSSSSYPQKLPKITPRTAPSSRLVAFREYVAARRREDGEIVIPNLRKLKSIEALNVLGRHYAALRRQLLNPM